MNGDIHTQGLTRVGVPVSAGTVTYLASLSKQMLCALVAGLVRDDGLDLNEPIAGHLPELPAWAARVRIRHLIHHLGALPHVADTIDSDRTGDAVIDSIAHVGVLDGVPGTAYAYSNAGYVCLGRILERIVGPLPAYARDVVFRPLGMRDTFFWDGPDPWPPGGAPLAQAHPAPLSLGDGGAWGTAADLLRWGAALNSDALGLTDLLQTPGRFDDGTALDYAWGMGVRTMRGLAVYRHGGGWTGSRSMLVRVPDRGLTIVVLALDDDTERRVGLTDALLDALL